MFVLLGKSVILRVLIVLFSLLLPKIILENYTISEYAKYSYLIMISSYLSLFQGGVVPYFRLMVQKEKEKIDSFYTISLQSTLVIFILAFLTLLLLINSVGPYTLNFIESLIFSILASTVLFYTLVQCFYDIKERSIKFRLLEVYASLVAVILIYIFGYSGYTVVIIASIWAGWRGLYSLMLSLTYFKGGEKTHLRSIFSYTKSAINVSSIFLFIQVVNLFITLVPVYLITYKLGEESFGEYALYYRFVFFPLILYAGVSSLIWTRLSEEKNGHFELIKKLYIIVVISSALWCITSSLFISDFLEFFVSYSSHDFSVPLMSILFFLTILRDFQSTILNVNFNFKTQVICLSFIFISNVCLVIKPQFVINDFFVVNILSIGIVNVVYYIFVRNVNFKRAV